MNEQEKKCNGNKQNKQYTSASGLSLNNSLIALYSSQKQIRISLQKISFLNVPITNKTIFLSNFFFTYFIYYYFCLILVIKWREQNKDMKSLKNALYKNNL